MRLARFVKVALCGVTLGLSACGLAPTDGVGAAAEFSPAQLARPPGANWATNGGNLLNQRYSTLDKINKENVGQLKGVWRASLGGSGMGPGFSA